MSDDGDGGDVVRPVVAVVVTHVGPGPLLDRCLHALDADRRPDAAGMARIVVVDNGDHPAPPTAAYGAADVVLRPENRGFGAAVNVGIEAARRMVGGATDVMVFNDDTMVRTGWLAPLVAGLAAPRVGAVQPKLLLADREPPAVNSVGVVVDRHGAAADDGFGEPDGPRWEERREIAAFTGGAVLLRDEFLRDVGGFDERYFLYYEDVDLALRGAESGWTYLCEPASVVEHVLSSTVSRDPDRAVYLRERNRLWTCFRFQPLRTIVRGLWLSVRRLRHRPRGAHLRGLAAGSAAAPRLVAARIRARRRREVSR